MSEPSDRVNAAFRRYLTELKDKGFVDPEIFDGLSPQERNDLTGLIEVYDLVGAAWCPTAPSPGFAARVQARLEQEQKEIQGAASQEMDLFGDAVRPASFPEGQSFGTWLKARRKILQLTHNQVGASAGCSGAQIANLEGGYSSPTVLAPEQLKRLSAAIQVTWAEMLEMVRMVPGHTPRHAVGLARSTDPARDFSEEYRLLLDQARSQEGEEEG